MRKSISIFVVAAWGFLTVLTANAQKTKTFAGTVKLAVRYEGNTNPNEHIPSEQVYTIFGNKQKVVIPARYITQIIDGDAVKLTVLLDYPGYKSGFSIIKEETENHEYTYTKKEGDTMTICGYLCTRYDVTVYDKEEDEEKSAIVYTTTEIGENNNINAFEFPGLTGYPLYREVENQGVKTIVKAIEIKQTKIKSVDFLIPEGYKMFPNQEEWKEYLDAASGKGE